MGAMAAMSSSPAVRNRRPLGTRSLQVKLKLLGPLSGLEDHPERIWRGACAVRRLDRLRSGELKLPANGNVAGDTGGHALASAPHAEPHGLGTLGR